MTEENRRRFGGRITRQIKSTRKQITILFTDIEDSTRYWDTRGDINGRLMVDYHNRLIFAVIKKFRGKIIKTIGDAIMASFSRSEQAVKAAIGIQQILQKTRRQDKNFGLKVRIGIHTGKAIVEHSDVFGDVVNVAARIEQIGQGNEIFLSENTADKIDKKAFGLVKSVSFTPRGKTRKIKVYRCEWGSLDKLIDGIQIYPFLAMKLRQKIEISIYALSCAGILYFLYIKYIRYILADSESLALFYLNPQHFINVPPVVPAILGAIAFLATVLLVRMTTVPHFIFMMLKGSFGFCIGFFLVYLLATFIPLEYIPLKIETILNKGIFQSSHLFVEVKANDTNIMEKPSIKSESLKKVDKGNLLLLTDVKKIDRLTWNKVLIGKKNYGWILRVIPATIGVPEKRMTISYKFYFKYIDLFTLFIGSIGFIWGFLNFRLRPV
ncbi:MAG: adenylate/guanylate cyclase domain-containing protein [Desulfobacterales bacterium]|nr:adenylate/guanylate cyclase domain-containing protein [Desulfobacterales bacterium]MDX2510230.1 adenylate/guanylate cyclase domain-containing protein [Desulfobacterales bacterium]